MTIAGRINSFFIGAAVIMGIAATYAAATREYNIQLDHLVDASKAQLLSRPDLQVHFYERDSARLGDFLAELTAIRGTSAAVAYSSIGEELARSGAGKVAGFNIVREGLLELDVALVDPGSKDTTVDTSLWASLWNRADPIYLTAPVFSSLNPVESGHSPEDFFNAMVDPDKPELRQVIGYVHSVIDRRQLLAATGPTIQRIGGGSALFVLLFSLLAWLLSRRISHPLQQLAAMADDVAAGRLENPIEIDGVGEVREIAQLLNGVLDGLKDYRHEQDVSQRLLSRKVEERSNQLNERHQQFHRAVEEVAVTRNRLQQLANYDSLTKLPNRRLFTEQMDVLLRLSERNKQTLALLFVDIDDFKRINDSLGLSMGDQLLSIVAERLAKCVRHSDMVGHFDGPNIDIKVSRLGGDEFTVVLNQVESREAVRDVAQRIIDFVAQPVQLDGHEIVVKTRVGIALAPENGTDAESLLQAASTAKHHARDAAHKGIAFYHPDMSSAGEERMLMEEALRKALINGELELHYQPQVDIHSGSVVGAEALLRWTHPDLGPIPPSKFIRLAEEIGIISELGDWVLMEACHQVIRFDAEDIKLPRVSINVSALEFSHEFVEKVSDVLEATGLAPERLELGLTEAIMLDEDNNTRRALQELHDAGIYLSVDDFGTGYSPLSYLTKYPIDELKLDRSFVLEAERSEKGAQLVTAIIAMARSLDLRLLVGGVESEEQLRFLSSQGACVMQGYLFSKPVPAEQLRSMLSPWHFMAGVQRILYRDSAEA